MTQSLMFIPVIRCVEEDFYFIVVECIAAAMYPLPVGLFRKHYSPPEARYNPRMKESVMHSANC